jgi:hypothetical protein
MRNSLQSIQITLSEQEWEEIAGKNWATTKGQLFGLAIEQILARGDIIAPQQRSPVARFSHGVAIERTYYESLKKLARQKRFKMGQAIRAELLLNFPEPRTIERSPRKERIDLSAAHICPSCGEKSLWNRDRRMDAWCGLCQYTTNYQVAN